MRAVDGLEGCKKLPALAVFSKKKNFFERPQAEFQIDAVLRVYTNCWAKQRNI